MDPKYKKMKIIIFFTNSPSNFPNDTSFSFLTTTEEHAVVHSKVFPSETSRSQEFVKSAYLFLSGGNFKKKTI